MLTLKMLTKGVHYEMEKWLYYEAKVIRAEYKLSTQKPNEATKKTPVGFIMGVRQTLSFLSASWPLNKPSSFAAKALGPSASCWECFLLAST